MPIPIKWLLVRAKTSATTSLSAVRAIAKRMGWLEAMIGAVIAAVSIVLITDQFSSSPPHLVRLHVYGTCEAPGLRQSGDPSLELELFMFPYSILAQLELPRAIAENCQQLTIVSSHRFEHAIARIEKQGAGSASILQSDWWKGEPPAHAAVFEITPHTKILWARIMGIDPTGYWSTDLAIDYAKFNSHDGVPRRLGDIFQRSKIPIISTLGVYPGLNMLMTSSLPTPDSISVDRRALFADESDYAKRAYALGFRFNVETEPRVLVLRFESREAQRKSIVSTLWLTTFFGIGVGLMLDCLKRYFRGREHLSQRVPEKWNVSSFDDD